MAKMEWHMPVLHIKEVIDHLETYKKNYNLILNTASQYYQIVQDAEFSFSCISTQTLYLGDLLQLWNYLYPSFASEPQYLFSIKCDYLNKKAVAYTWKPNEKQINCYELKEALSIYCAFIQFKRPKRNIKI